MKIRLIYKNGHEMVVNVGDTIRGARHGLERPIDAEWVGLPNKFLTDEEKVWMYQDLPNVLHGMSGKVVPKLISMI